MLSSLSLLPLGSCGTESSSTSTAVYSEAADEARVFIGPLKKASGSVGVWPDDNFLPMMDECTFNSSPTEEDTIRHVGRQTHRLQLSIRRETGRSYSPLRTLEH